MPNILKLIAFLVLALPSQTVLATTISFSGYQWDVRSGVGGPGPNNWSDQNVSVDSSGDLHLKLTLDSHGQWNAAELVSNQLFGFGTYQFQLLGRPDQLDKNVVFGLFNYPPPSVGPDGTNEIDIEFATFGGAQSNPHGNWTVWPAVTGVGNTTHQFDTALNGDPSTHRFTWSSQQIIFQALSGLTDTNIGEYASWSYSPTDYLQRIPQNPMPLHMNLWLFGGNPPTDGRTVEVIVSNFTFTPLASVPEPGTGPLIAAGFGTLWVVARRRSRTELARMQ